MVWYEKLLSELTSSILSEKTVALAQKWNNPFTCILLHSIHVYPFLYWFVAWINVICLTWLGWNFCHSLLVAVNRILLEFGNWTQTYFFFFDKFYLIGRQKLRKLRCFVKTFDKGGALCLLRLLPSSLCCQPLPGGWARQFQKSHSLLLSTR